MTRQPGLHLPDFDHSLIHAKGPAGSQQTVRGLQSYLDRDNPPLRRTVHRERGLGVKRRDLLKGLTLACSLIVIPAHADRDDNQDQ
jgi:hypothetical protein